MPRGAPGCTPRLVLVMEGLSRRGVGCDAPVFPSPVAALPQDTAQNGMNSALPALKCCWALQSRILVYNYHSLTLECFPD